MTKTFNEMTRDERVAKLHQMAIQAIEKHGLFIQGVGGDEERNLSPYAYSNGVSHKKETPFEFLFIGHYSVASIINECFELKTKEENKDYESLVFVTAKNENEQTKFNLVKIDNKELIQRLKKTKTLAWNSYNCNPEYVWLIVIANENNETPLKLGKTKEVVIDELLKEI